MIGFQGPESERLLQGLVSADLSTLRYYAAVKSTVYRKNALVARTGYTGEDGFEVIVSAKDGPEVWDVLLEERFGVQPVAAGLGARDTLRLEAGMPLYGHEIDEDANPFEAGLGRVVKLAKGEFGGSKALAEISEHGVERKLIAFELTAGGVPRQGYPILDGEKSVGQVTSGNVSPSLGTPIGMAYVPTSTRRARHRDRRRDPRQGRPGEGHDPAVLRPQNEEDRAVASGASLRARRTLRGPNRSPLHRQSTSG